MPDKKIGGMPVTQMGTEGPPKWVQEMQAHYSATGAFRLQDVQRVLGDQRTVVGIAANQSLSASTLVGRK
jgi:hypothetical protein